MANVVLLDQQGVPAAVVGANERELLRTFTAGGFVAAIAIDGHRCVEFVLAVASMDRVHIQQVFYIITNNVRAVLLTDPMLVTAYVLFGAGLFAFKQNLPNAMNNLRQCCNDIKDVYECYQAGHINTAQLMLRVGIEVGAFVVKSAAGFIQKLFARIIEQPLQAFEDLVQWVTELLQDVFGRIRNAVVAIAAPGQQALGQPAQQEQQGQPVQQGQEGQ